MTRLADRGLDSTGCWPDRTRFSVVDQLTCYDDRSCLALPHVVSRRYSGQLGLPPGVVTIGSRYLCFRYRHARLSDSAAAEFAAGYVDVLDGFAGQGRR